MDYIWNKDPKQYSSRMGTERVKQEEEPDSSMKFRRKERGYERVTSA